jgi:phosphatidate cytidylyltransferase
MSAAIELPVRAMSALVMAAVAIFVTIVGGVLFACLVAIGAVAALREWHRLINGGRFANEALISAAAVAGAVFVSLFLEDSEASLLLLVAGAVAAFLWSAHRKQSPFWHALGPVYVGLAAIALVLLRAAPSGAYLILGIFIAVWSADTGALLGGRIIGGPKLVPRVSPNKTWAGFLAGTLAAGLAEAAFFAILGRSAAFGLILGLLIALIGHAGDLFESWVKRCFRAKDSGGLIPGHGGILDRIDSLLFVAPACAILLVFTSLNPL